MVKQLVALSLALCVVVGSASYAQDDLVISGRGEIMMDFTRMDGGLEATGDDVDVDVFLKKQLSDTVRGQVKLDVEDSPAARGLIEEAFIVINAGSVDVAIGRKEVKAGQDKMLWETFPLMHKNESDNKFALEAGIKAGEKAKVFVTIFQENIATWDSDGDGTNDEAIDKLQSFALKGEIGLADNLQLNVSVLNGHDESQQGAGVSTDEQEICVGIVYNDKDAGMCVFFEYMMVTAWNYTDGDDGSCMQLGAKLGLGEKLSVGLLVEQQTSSMTAGDTRDEVQGIAGIGFKVDEKCELFAELTMYRDNLIAWEASLLTVGSMLTF